MRKATATVFVNLKTPKKKLIESNQVTQYYCSVEFYKIALKLHNCIDNAAYHF